MEQLTELKQNAVQYIAWRRIDEGFDHEIYLEMNPDNCSYLLSSFDSIKRKKWEEYAKDN